PARQRGRGPSPRAPLSLCLLLDIRPAAPTAMRVGPGRFSGQGGRYGPMSHVRIRPAGLGDIATLFAIRTSVRENHQSVEELAGIGVTPETIAAMLLSTSRAWIAEVDGVPAASRWRTARSGRSSGCSCAPSTRDGASGARCCG